MILGFGLAYLSVTVAVSAVFKPIFRPIIFILSLALLAAIALRDFESLILFVFILSFLLAIPSTILMCLLPVFVLTAIVLLAMIWRRNSKANLELVIGFAVIFHLTTIAFIFGRGYGLRQIDYDERIEIGGKAYHSIVVNGYLGDFGRVVVYECQLEAFFCHNIFVSSPQHYDEENTQLIYKEATGVLLVETSFEDFEIQLQVNGE